MATIVQAIVTFLLSVTVVWLLFRNHRAGKRLDDSHEKLMSSYDSLGDVVGEMSEFVDRIEGSVRPTTREVEVSSGTGRGSSESTAFTTRWIEAAALRRFWEFHPNIGMRTGFKGETCPTCGSFLGRELPLADRYMGFRTTEIQPMGVSANLAFEGDEGGTISIITARSSPMVVGRPMTARSGGVVAAGAYGRYADEPVHGYPNVYPHGPGWEWSHYFTETPDPSYSVDILVNWAHGFRRADEPEFARYFDFYRGMMGRYGYRVYRGQADPLGRVYPHDPHPSLVPDVEAGQRGGAVGQHRQRGV